MAETPDDAVQPRGDLFELGMVVSDRVELGTVILTESRCWREPSLKPPSEDSSLFFEIEEINHAKNLADKIVFVKISFSSRDGVQGGKVPDSFSVLATFVLIYSISSFEGIDERNIIAFATTNGIYNAWPYWREFLQNTTTRMGFPPVIAPPFRFGTGEAVKPVDEKVPHDSDG